MSGLFFALDPDGPLVVDDLAPVPGGVGILFDVPPGREAERATAMQRLLDAQEVLRAAQVGAAGCPDVGTARVRVAHRAAVVRAEQDMEQRRRDFETGG